MAANTIKGLTVEIGGDTTKLGKALEDVNKQSGALSKELGEVNKLLKLDPGNTELLAQKQKILADAIDNTGDKLGTLKEAEQQVQKQFERGEVSEEQVRALKREVIATEKKMAGYERAAKETAEAVEDVGDESKEAAEKSDDLADALSNGVKVGLAAVAAGCAAAVAAIASSVEATAEYRNEMAKLDTAFTQAGHSSAVATKTYEELQSILGDSGQAVEAASHLALLTNNEKDLATWTDIAAGVYGTFGSSIPIEALAEAANETAKTGALTGALGDALKRAGVSEEKFQDKLEKCKTEQQRTALITETLIDLYGDTAEAFRENNAEVIRSNKITEKMNKAWARVGEKAAPVVNTFREGVADLAESFADLLEEADTDKLTKSIKKGFKELSNNVLPKLIKALEWVVDNFDLIKSVAIGAGVALVSYKVAVIAAEVAQKGLKASIMATTVAQKALNLVQAATPWGLAAAAISAVVVGVTAYCSSTSKATKETQVLTEEELELISATREAAQAFREQRQATAQTAGGIVSQMDHVKKLSDELQTLADKSGKVHENDRARAQFILGELNSALGTEYSMTGNVIRQYQSLVSNVEALINAKTTELLLEAHQDDYVEALQERNGALQALTLAHEAYAAQQDAVAEREERLAEAQAAFNRLSINASDAERRRASAVVNSAQSALAAQREILAEKKEAYDQAAADYNGYVTTIENYTAAQTASLQGNHDMAVALLAGESQAQTQHADVVETETRRTLDTLFTRAVEAGAAAANTKKNFENGVAGYTQAMVDEAERGYQEALAAYGDAYDDAHGVGEDLVDGVSGGMESRRSSALGTIRNIVSAIVAAAQDEADIHSPSRVMRDEVGKQLSQGVAVGIKQNQSEAEKASEDLASAVLSNAQKRLDNYKTYNTLTLANEVAFWNGVRAQVKEGTAARLSADQKYFAAKKSMDDQLTAAEKQYQDAIAETQKKVEDRTSAILSGMGLFNEVSGRSVDRRDLMTNLEDQVKVMEVYGETMEALEGKIGGTALFKELQSMGVDNVWEAAAINRMTDQELAQYIELYEKRAQLAREQAENELGDEVAKAQAEAYQTYIDTCAELGVAVNTANDAMVAHTQAALEQLQAVAVQAQAVAATISAAGVDPAMLGAAGVTTAPAASGNNSAILSKLDAIYKRLNSLKVYLDGDTLVGEIVDEMDAALAGRQALYERGV